MSAEDDESLELPVKLSDIERAHTDIKDAVVCSDMDLSRTLSSKLSAEVWLKFENLQFTASFKERGALNKLLSLTQKERQAGVIAMSAGNHAQGVAYHAKRLGIRAVIVMPEGTPSIKVQNTKSHDAEVLIRGSSVEDAATFAKQHASHEGLVFVHPYDDEKIIAGQGTIAIEMLQQTPDLDVLIVPVGGGGLISGMAIAAKALRPQIEIIGVQSRLFPSMINALKGAALPLGGDTLAEGIAVKSPGKLTRIIAGALVDDFVLVDEADLERAVLALIEIEKTVVEGAGAAGLAAMLAAPERFQGRRVGLILCGGNIDTGLLSSVLTRGLARAGRLTELAIDLLDRPGQLARLAAAVGEAGANIVDIAHQRVFTDLPAKSARAHIVVETRDREHLSATVAAIQNAGLKVEKISE